MKYRLIVFDWDGTLMDSSARIVSCYKNAARDAGLDVPTDNAILKLIGLGLEESCDILFPAAGPGRKQTAVDRYREHFIHLDDTHMPLFPGVAAGLSDLNAKGYWLAVATGKSRGGLDSALDESQVRDYFLTTRCADEAGTKPNPQMLFDVLEATGVEAGEAIMIGDTSYDLQMAKNAKIDGLGVTYGCHSVDELMELEPIACLDSFSKVCSWFTEESV